MNVADLVHAMDAIAPARLAATWDNVGLLVGDPQTPLTRALVTVDCTRDVLEEARSQRCEAIVAYHPPLFKPVARLTSGSIAYELVRSGLAALSPHTALDAAEGGTNDVLADILEMGGRLPLRAIDPVETTVKLVTFVPADHVEAVGVALFAAGAGRIGKYTSCSFRAPGTGTFFGEEGTSPTVGSAGHLEHAPEIRLETPVPVARVSEAVAALRRSHPYEEPAFDLVRLAPEPIARGMGRVGSVRPAPLAVFVERIKRALGAAHVLVGGALDREVSRAAVCAGSGGDLLGDAIDAGAQLFVTGELRHHDALRASAAGCAVVCTLHSVSERVALRSFAKRLSERLQGAEFLLSEADREPLAFA
jgi:dinuclear metal center YbgI/SA1388 family protein